MRNLFSRLRKIEEHMESIPDGIQTLKFKDGTTKDVHVRKMFDSIMNGEPNKDVQFLLDKLKAGFPDEGGLVHLVEVYNTPNDPEAMAKLWEDEAQ